MVPDLFDTPRWDDVLPALRRDRALALQTVAAAVSYADPANAVMRGASMAGLTDAGLRRCAVVSFGKAAASMMAGLYSVGLCHSGVVVAPAPTGADAKATVRARQFCELQAELRCLFSAHPLPNAQSVAAAQAVVAFVEAAAADEAVDHLVFLISGGGSSLLEWPVEGVTLAELQATYRALLGSGAPITVINRVRPYLSRVKGGGLLAAGGGMAVTNLVISDVVDGPIEAVASGPSMAPLRFDERVEAVLGAFMDVRELPSSVQLALKRPLPTFDAHRVSSWTIADNAGAQQAMMSRAADLGLRPMLRSARVEGEASTMGETFVREAVALGADVYIGGGECTVTLGAEPGGQGGRNQEFVLGGLSALPESGGCLVSLGTDGVDGQSPLAGGLVDAAVQSAIHRQALDVSRALAEHDSTPLLETAGGGLRTGPTGTNVADVCAFIRGGIGSHLP